MMATNIENHVTFIKDKIAVPLQNAGSAFPCMAARLAEGIVAGTPFVLAHPVEANTVFVRMSEAAHARLTAAGWACYRFDDGSVRFVCSWATAEQAVDELLAAMRTV